MQQIEEDGGLNVNDAMEDRAKTRMTASLGGRYDRPVRPVAGQAVQ